MRQGINDSGDRRTNWLFLLAGQSNAYGNALTSDLSAENASYADVYPGCNQCLQTGCYSDSDPQVVCAVEGPWESLQPRNNGGMGSALSLGRALADAMPSADDVPWLYNASEGGSSMAVDWKPTATTGRLLYAKAKRFFLDNRALVDSGRLKFGGLFWVQGEADSITESYANAYEENLLALIDDVATSFGPGPIVISRLSSQMSSWAYKSTVVAAQDAVATARGNVTAIDTDALTMQGDATHYTADSYISLGDLMAVPAISHWGLS